MCVLRCPSGIYADIASGTCTTTCLPLNSVKTYGDNSTSKCVAICPDLTYGDDNTLLCTSLCPINYYADNKTRKFVLATSCDLNTYGDPITRRCVSAKNCPIYPYYFADPSTNTCVIICPSNYWGDKVSNLCLL